MANYKKLDTLVKAFSEITDEMLTDIIDNDMVDVSTLSDKEKLSVLVFAELAKALNNKEHTLCLDCNYAASKFHQHEDEADDQWLVDYYRLVPNANKNSTLIQFYVNADPKREKCTINLYTSCAKANREQFEALEDDLKFTVKRDTKTGRAKTSNRSNIDYEDVVEIAKAVCAILAQTSAADEKAKAEKKATKEAEKKAKAEQREKEKAEKPKKQKTKEVEEATDDPAEFEEADTEA